MKRRALYLLLLCFLFNSVVAQQFTTQTENGVTQIKDSVEYRPSSGGLKQFQKPVYRGMSLHLDVASPIMGAINGKVYNAEVQIDVNLYRRLYPILEVGYTDAQKTFYNGTSFSTTAPFFRLGINYGLLKPFRDNGTMRSVKNYPFIGVRYGMSFMNYNIENVTVTADYWGKDQSLNYKKPFVYSGWIEIVGGVRIDIYKGLTMGWSVRLNTALHTSAADKSYVWYVPGYGKAASTAFSFNYTIGYTFYNDKNQ